MQKDEEKSEKSLTDRLDHDDDVNKQKRQKFSLQLLSFLFPPEHADVEV